MRGGGRDFFTSHIRWTCYEVNQPILGDQLPLCDLFLGHLPISHLFWVQPPISWAVLELTSSCSGDRNWGPMLHNVFEVKFLPIPSPPVFSYTSFNRLLKKNLCALPYPTPCLSHVFCLWLLYLCTCYLLVPMCVQAFTCAKVCACALMFVIWTGDGL